MLGIIGFIFLGIIYIALPFWLQVILTAVNTGVPDPIPVLDEVLMYGSIIKKMLTFIDASDRLDNFVTWWKMHVSLKKIGKVILVLIVIGVIISLF